jgi:2-desacetyl-2-hydroxyethyl bacteriochlorophyllide A dehydrogenase
MKGITFTGNRTLEVRNFPDPTPGPRDVVLEIKASGMCGTDLGAYRAPSGRIEVGASEIEGPVIAGHEPCGVVVAVGSAVDAREAKVGDRVMDHHYDGCGVCRHCLSGWTQMCLEDAVAYGYGGHGAHAKYMRVAAHSLVPLPDAVSFPAGAAVACGTGTAYGALKRIGLKGDETVAVFGQGPVGLSATMLAVEMGARVIAVELSPERRQLALDWGADAVIDPGATDAVEAIKDLTHGEGADKTVDCTSSVDARRSAVRSTRIWGTACMVGVGGELNVDVTRDLIFRQLNIVGHWTFSKVIQADCARFIADRKIDLDKIFTHQWSVDQATEAYELFDQAKTGKGVFVSFD